jgi:hypothetical protein
MARRGEMNAISELQGYWRRWLRIVELFAHRRRARRWVDSRSYDMLYANLVEACHSLADMVEADSEERAYFQNLEHLALPWVSLQSLQAADREILGDLFIRARQAESELSGRTWAVPSLRQPVQWLATIVTWAGLVIVFWVAGNAWLPILDRGRSWQEAVALCVARTQYNMHSLFLPAMFVVAFSSYMVSRTARS